MADRSAVNFFYCAVWKSFNIRVAFSTADFGVDRLVVEGFIDIVEVLLALFINSSQA